MQPSNVCDVETSRYLKMSYYSIARVEYI